MVAAAHRARGLAEGVRVTMVNKNVRMLSAVMTREQGFDPRHVSVKPRAKCGATAALTAA